MTKKNVFRDVFGGFWSLLTGMRITLGQFLQPTLTVQYPRERLQLPARFRGHIKLVLDPQTGASRCTACNLCARACPSECITVNGEKKEGQKTKSVTDYHLNFTTCSLCGSCIEACPFDAIEFSKDYNVVAFSRDAFDNMDLVARLAEERKVWERHRPPQPPAAPATPAPATPAAGSATPSAKPATATPAATVAGGADPGPASPKPATSVPATTAAPTAQPQPKEHKPSP